MNRRPGRRPGEGCRIVLPLVMFYVNVALSGQKSCVGDLEKDP